MAVIIVVGLARSGKDTFADYLVEKYGFSKFVFSDMLAEELVKRGEEVTKENMSRLGNELRAKEGMDAVAKRLVEKLKGVGNNKLVLVGPRSVEEVNYVKGKLGKVIVVETYAKKESRFKRRSDKDPGKEKEFFGRDEGDIETKGLGEVLKMTDRILENKGSLKDFYMKADRFMEQWLE